MTRVVIPSERSESRDLHLALWFHAEHAEERHAENGSFGRNPPSVGQLL